jgi:UDP-N-acetylglucosamine:LPS N-acetylglucosamine transferase
MPNRVPRRVPPGSSYKILFVSSSGGHLSYLTRLRPWWEHRDRLWVTFDKPDARGALKGEHVVWGHHPVTRNIPNLLRNVALAVRTIRAERPDVIFSTGAGIGLPFIWIGRLFGCRTVYMEVMDRFQVPTLNAKLCRPASELFLTQLPQQQEFFPNSLLVGPVY